MKRTTYILLTILLILSLCSCSVKENPVIESSNSGSEVTNESEITNIHYDSDPENFEYRIESYTDYTAKINKYIGTSENVAVPESIDGYTIIGFVGVDCFGENIENISFPDTIEDAYNELINTTAFYNNESNWLDDAFYIDDLLISVKEDVSNFVVPDGVKRIASYAFSDCEGIEEIIIPDSVISIGSGAFRDCTKLRKISLGGGLKKIDSTAFDGCTALETLEIPDSMKNSDLSAFSNEDLISLDSASIDKREVSGGTYINNCLVEVSSDVSGEFCVLEGTTYISDLAFYCCRDITKIVIPDTVETIGEAAFCECEELETIVLVNGLKCLGEYAFQGCKRLTSVTIPDTVSRMGISMFTECDNLESIYISENNENFLCDDLGAIYSKDKKILYCVPICPAISLSSDTSYTILDGTERICGYAFQNCDDLDIINLPKTLIRIDSYAFSNCEHLDQLIIPANVEYIGENIIPTSYSSVDDDFWGNSSLTSISVDEGNKYFCVVDGVLYNYDKTLLILAATNVENIAMPNSVKKISERAFAFSDVKSIKFSDSLTKIDKMAFMGCKNLEEIILPDTLECVGEDAFELCEMITKVNIPKNMTVIGCRAFAGLSKITEIRIPGTVKMVDKYAFDGCNSLEKIIIEEGVESISYAGLGYCENLNSVVIPSSVLSIDEDAFVGSNNLSSVFFGGSEEEWNKFDLEDIEDVVVQCNYNLN